MGCNCGKAKAQLFKVKMPGGITVIKKTEAAALAFAAKHPGSTIVKPSA